MKFENLILDVLLEEYANKRVFNACLLKWFGETPTEEQSDLTEKLLTRYDALKRNGRFVYSSHHIYAFIIKFPRFNPFDDYGDEKEHVPLTQPELFSLDEMKYLITLFYADMSEDENSTYIHPLLVGDRTATGHLKFPSMLSSNPQPLPLVQASKETLWEGKNYIVVEEPGFRVYEPPDMITSIRFGFYEQYLAVSELYYKITNHQTNNPWCVTWLPESSNYWGHYRSTRTFYFVIDESKNPAIEPDRAKNQYYLSALQKCTPAESMTTWRLTSIINDGDDPVVSEAQLLAIYPKLSGHLDKFRVVEYNNSELGVGVQTEIMSLIHENINGNRNHLFSVQTPEIQKMYIDAGRPIATIESWNSMDPDLRKVYIGLCNQTTFTERIPAKLYNALKSDRFQNHKQELNYIKVKAEQLGINFATLCKKWTNDIYSIFKTSSNNSNIVLLESHIEPKKYGIFDAGKDDWLEFEGIKYDGDKGYYNKANALNSLRNITDSGAAKRFVVMMYSHNGTVDNKNFYCIYNSFNVNEAYFLNHVSWLKLKEEYDAKASTPGPVDISVGNYKDIKEEGFIPKSKLTLSSIV